MDALALTEDQINGLEAAINEEGDPLAGARRWVSENRGVVRPWIEAARTPARNGSEFSTHSGE
jgi:ABC-type proline/glycine betaine transport system substrate-binding protein